MCTCACIYDFCTDILITFNICRFRIANCSELSINATFSQTRLGTLAKFRIASNRRIVALTYFAGVWTACQLFLIIPLRHIRISAIPGHIVGANNDEYKNII